MFHVKQTFLAKFEQMEKKNSLIDHSNVIMYNEWDIHEWLMRKEWVLYRHEPLINWGEGMNISIQKLLGKIEQELQEAKESSTDARMRERVHAIQSLCELILEDSEMGRSPFVPKKIESPPTEKNQPATIQQTKRMQMDDNSNGDSLFDF